MKELKDQIKRLNTEIEALKSFLLEKFFCCKKSCWKENIIQLKTVTTLNH